MCRALIPGLVILLILVLSACSSGSDETSQSTAPSSSDTPAVSPTAVPVEPEPSSTPTPIPSPTNTPSPTPSPTPHSVPVAVIEEIAPNPVYVNQEVTFRGSGSDPLVGVNAYKWSIEGHGAIAHKDVFSSTVVTRTAGTYTVVFEVQNNIGVWSPGVQQTLTVLAVPPSASFRATPLFGNVPLSVRFTDLSSREITGRTWDFGDGNISTEKSPTHVYSDAGTFDVRLTVQGPAGSDTELKEGFIETVDIDFVADVTVGHKPIEVQFTDRSGGDISDWLWTFGDGHTGTERNPVHIYRTAGVFDVTLTVTFGSGNAAAESRAHYIRVLEPAPVADFYSHPSVLVNTPEQFADFSTGVITSWTWDFGDGNTSTLQNPTHVYLSSGTYTVTLVVTGPGGSDFHQRLIVVEAP